VKSSNTQTSTPADTNHATTVDAKEAKAICREIRRAAQGPGTDEALLLSALNKIKSKAEFGEIDKVYASLFPPNTIMSTLQDELNGNESEYPAIAKKMQSFGHDIGKKRWSGRGVNTKSSASSASVNSDAATTAIPAAGNTSASTVPAPATAAVSNKTPQEIARRTQEIVKLNKGVDPKKLQIGQKITLPKGKVYTVKSGDTLSKIAALPESTTNIAKMLVNSFRF
jgi:LysM repeat protein